MSGRPLALFAFLLADVACVDVEVRLRGPARPGRPAGCKVDLFPDEKGGPPNVGFEDVAWVTVRCRTRERCIEELRKQACVTGADAVYGFHESTEDGYTNIDARYAARGSGSGGSGSGSSKSFGPDPGWLDLPGRPAHDSL